jgi:hypothetical protein
LRQLGVRREVFPQFGVELVDQDIELTIDLDAEVPLSLPDAPMAEEAVQRTLKPTITRVVPFLQIGGEGTFVYTQAVEGDRNHQLIEMPDVPGDMLTFISGAYTTDSRFSLIANDGLASLTAGSTRVSGIGNFWDASLVGAYFVADLPDGSRFASAIMAAPDPFLSELELQDPAPLSASSLTYHIGEAGPPSSEVIQDGTGDMRSGVTIQPVLGLAEPLSPVENGALIDRTVRWKPAPGVAPSIHELLLFDAFGVEGDFWDVFVDGTRTKVVLPKVPTLEATLLAVPRTQQEVLLSDQWIQPRDMAAGGYIWQHLSTLVIGLDFQNWSYFEIGGRNRRSFSTDVHLFVHGGD